MIRETSPIVGAFLFAGCALFSSPPAKPSAEQLAKARAVAACVADAQCASRACLEAAILHCSADAISPGGGGGEAGAAGFGG